MDDCWKIREWYIFWKDEGRIKEKWKKEYCYIGKLDEKLKKNCFMKKGRMKEE